MQHGMFVQNELVAHGCTEPGYVGSCVYDMQLTKSLCSRTTIFFMLRGLSSVETHSSTQPAAVTSLISMLNWYSPGGEREEGGREGERERGRERGREGERGGEVREEKGRRRHVGDERRSRI